MEIKTGEEYYDKITIVINTPQNTIFLSKPIDLSEYSFFLTEIDGFIGTAPDLKEILESFPNYNVAIVSPTEMKGLLTSWGLKKSKRYSRGEK
jgi:hypothetical protein